MIDDDMVIREFAKGFLTREGYEVIEAADAPSGFAAALEHRPDIILSDFIMPGVLDSAGGNLFEKLSSDPRTKDIPVVITSALPKIAVQGVIPRHLWPRVMSKPFDFFDLKKLIESILKDKKTGSGSPLGKRARA